MRAFNHFKNIKKIIYVKSIAILKKALYYNTDIGQTQTQSESEGRGEETESRHQDKRKAKSEKVNLLRVAECENTPKKATNGKDDRSKKFIYLFSDTL